MSIKVNRKLFNHAFELLSEMLEPSPLVKNIRLSQKYNCNIYLKLENMLPVGSFKMRGALYKLSQLSSKEKKQGVLAVSAGNHAQGVAWAARELGIKATIMMPKNSPLTKIENTEALGAKILLVGQNVEDCFNYAKEYLVKNKLCFIHPFEDEQIIAGQGSIGYELNDQLAKIDYVIGSIGGGGLMAGIGHVMKELSPQTTVIAAQASGANSMVESLRKKKLVKPRSQADTFADGIKVTKPSSEMFKLLKPVVDEVIDCSDELVAIAVLDLIEKAHIVAEGAGALPLAAFDCLWHKDPKRFTGKNIVLVVCGGNIDVNLIGKIIDRGLIFKGRRVRLIVEVVDRPGILADLTARISDQGGNILQVIHDHQSPKASLLNTLVELTIETTGAKHLEQIIKVLSKHYLKVDLMDV